MRILLPGLFRIILLVAFLTPAFTLLRAQSFDIPDTVCVNQPVTISNTTAGAQNYYWNFCVADLNKTPIAMNIGNPGNLLSQPVFMDYVFYNNAYYGFSINHYPGKLVRLDFGNSLLNIPTAVDLGNFGGIIPPGYGAEGIQVVQNGGSWYAIIVGGYTPSGSTPRILKIDFGANLTNVAPVATNWGNIGNLWQPIDLHVFQENGNWYGFTINAENNTITRFNFTNSFANTPTAINLGGFGMLDYPTGIYAINDNGFWRVFITNHGSGSRLVRLDFGNSLLNNPTAVNLGSMANADGFRDLTIIKNCNQIVGFAVNAPTNSLYRLNFATLASVPTVTNLGNIGNLSTPHSVSKIFRVNDDLYTFITNVGNNTITRLRFTGCSNANPASSVLQNPAPVIYNTPGTYNINLSIDDGLPTQSSLCKQVVVKDCTAPIIPDFDIPDTVCVNQPVHVINRTVGASSHFWNFDVADLKSSPVASNIGNPGNLLSLPVFMDYVFFNNNWYGFVINHNPGGLVRLNFGNSLLNAPTATNLGDFGGVIPPGGGDAEGIQMVFNEGKWYAIIVGGYPLIGTQPRIAKIDFGPDLLNPAPVATNWGNIGNLLFPVDLHVFKENNNWYGFTVNAENNTIVRFNFSNSFDNIPTAVNLGNLGNLNFPTGIYAVNDNNDWKVFVLNRSKSTTYSITRLDFGNSLLNTPTAVNLGNPGNKLKQPRDFTIMKFCGQIIGFVVNEQGSDIVRLDFGNNLSSMPVATSLGNIGQMNFPHSISKFFRVGSDVYSFITNVNNNTITRLRFAGGTNSSIPNSTLQHPPDYSYSAAGTYNVNLTLDDGLPSQASLCKQIVVLPELEHKPTQSISACAGSSVKIGSSSATGTYQWSNGAIIDSIVVNTTGVYWVETTRYGCANRDTFNVTISQPPIVDLGADKVLCLPGNTVLDAGNPGSTYVWSNGSTNETITVNAAGKYYVRVTNGGCVASDTIVITTGTATSFDFNYQQNVCDPLSFQFNVIGTALANSYWDFGDGSSVTGNVTPVHKFATAGNYVVKYVEGNGTCRDTLRKTVSVNFLPDNLILTSDTTICHGLGKQLRTIPSLNFCWSPATYLDDPNSPIPTTTTPEDIVYHFTAEVTGANLISNGSFTNGNIGFTSEYEFTANNVTEGQYFVGSNPPAWNSSLNICGDHTSVNGNMMMVNGAPTPNVNVWKQTIAVTPNTNYAFSTWIQALWPPNPAQLQFAINGRDVGQLITAPLPTCTWTQFYTTWNSGNSTTAVISIVNKNTQVQGNDFALDDISFAPVFIKTDSVVIKVEKPLVRANADTIVCAGRTVSLNAGGAQTYAWSPATALSNAEIANPVATPVTTTQYVVTGTTASGCSAKDTVNVNIYQKPAIIVSNDTTICKNSQVQLSVTGGAKYSWTPAATLNNALISNPVASPTGNTKYYVVITDLLNCAYLDSVEVSFKPDAVFSVSNGVQVCKDASVQLSASGGDTYSWNPADGLSDPSVSNPVASPASTTDYSVTITENTCNQSSTLTTRLTILPSPTVNAQKSNDIDCSNDHSRLQATGANQYSWTPASTLNNSSIPNPVATPLATTDYVVEGIDASGCKGYDTITVKVDNVNKGGYLMPNAFTPNNDGLNDCYGIKYWGVILDLEFSIYNRWGERIFFTQNPGQCWDGTYKGVKQVNGVYVYMIKAKTSCESEVFRKGTFVLVR